MQCRPQRLSHMTQTEASTAPTPDVLWLADNWLSFSSDPPPSIAWLMEQEQRDKRVGELLRELHYSVTSNPPSPQHMVGCKSEDDYWLGQAQMYPGFTVTGLQAALDQKKSERRASSTAAPQA